VIGVAGHFPADARLLEDVHGLQQQRLAHPDVAGQRRQLQRPAERAEDGIEVVHGMAELVQAQGGIGPQPAFRIEGAFLEEAADRLAAVQEVLVTGMQRVAVRGEDRRLVGRRHVLPGQFQRPATQLETTLRVDEAGQDQEAFLPELAQLRLGKELAHGSPGRRTWPRLIRRRTCPPGDPCARGPG
jgi:hypothetical protein